MDGEIDEFLKSQIYVLKKQCLEDIHFPVCQLIYYVTFNIYYVTLISIMST